MITYLVSKIKFNTKKILGSYSDVQILCTFDKIASFHKNKFIPSNMDTSVDIYTEIMILYIVNM